MTRKSSTLSIYSSYYSFTKKIQQNIYYAHSVFNFNLSTNSKPESCAKSDKEQIPTFCTYLYQNYPYKFRSGLRIRN